MAPDDREAWTAYDAAADRYDESGEDDPEWRARYRAKFLAALSGVRVLEVGCGAGRDAAELARAGCAVVGVDASAELLAHARARCPDGRFVTGDFRALALADEAPFDGMWAMFCLFHARPDELPGCAASWRAHLRAGAPLFVGMADSTRLGERTVADWLGVPGNSCTFHYHPAERLARTLAQAGFVIEATHRDTPRAYQAAPYVDLGLGCYVIHARAA